MLCGKYRIRMGVHRCALAYARSAASHFGIESRIQNTSANKCCRQRSEFACDFWSEKNRINQTHNYIRRKVPFMAWLPLTWCGFSFYIVVCRCRTRIPSHSCEPSSAGADYWDFWKPLRKLRRRTSSLPSPSPYISLFVKMNIKKTPWSFHGQCRAVSISFTSASYASRHSWLALFVTHCDEGCAPWKWSIFENIYPFPVLKYLYISPEVRAHTYLRFRFDLYSHLQMSHENRHSPVWTSLCWFKLYVRVNSFEQNSQIFFFFSPVSGLKARK